MLRGKLIHPEILAAVGGAGHGSKILIADGNYPLGTRVGENATLVYLNLSPGKVLVTEVLEAILEGTPVEAAAVMTPADGGAAPIFAEFRELLGPDLDLEGLERFAFYEAASSPEVCLQVATGDQRLYANILLTIGVVV